jgi:urease accessory protein
MDMATNISTRTTTGTGTITEGLLPLLWLASPALPVGGFSYSEGLEAAVEAGLVTNEQQGADWLAQQLHLTLARAELVIVRRAIEAWKRCDLETIEELNDWVLRTRETAELRQQTEQMGRSMVEWVKSVKPGALTPALSQREREREREKSLAYPIAWAFAAASFDVDTKAAMHAFPFGWAENMVQAAVRVVPLGQSAGQRILARLAQEIPAAVDEAIARSEPQSFSPMLAILSSRHEIQYSRLFRS